MDQQIFLFGKRSDDVEVEIVERNNIEFLNASERMLVDVEIFGTLNVTRIYVSVDLFLVRVQLNYFFKKSCTEIVCEPSRRIYRQT